MPDILGGVFFLAFLALWIYCLFDVITTDESMVRNLPKMVWLVIVLVSADIGSIAWLLLGRPPKASFALPDNGFRSRRAAPTPDHLSVPPLADPRLERMGGVAREREEMARMRMWEAQLKRREDEVRARELGISGPGELPPAPGTGESESPG